MAQRPLRILPLPFLAALSTCNGWSEVLESPTTAASSSGGGGGGGLGSVSSNALIVTNPSIITNIDSAMYPCNLGMYGMGMGIPADTPFLLVASEPISCGSLQAANLSTSTCSPTLTVWEMCIAFAPGALAPGTGPYPPGPNPVNSVLATSGEEPNCGYGAETIQGKNYLTITAASASSVSFTLQGTTGIITPTNGNGPIDADGSYVALRCP
jgi:hypothetical protein